MFLESVVRVFATVQAPDYDSPWRPRVPESSTGSGVVVGPRRILTGAHVVANSTFIQVQKVSHPDKCTAKVIGVCHDIDLALLEVIDEQFLSDIEPQEIGELPELRDPVSVVGYPVGGDEISVTEGVVSRIELQRYRQSRRFFIAITVDAAINEGNSGGPAFKDGMVIGIAFQTLQDAENIGELVPSTLIRSFLAHVDRSPRMSLPALGTRVQELDNRHLRAHLGMPDGLGGALVAAVDYGSSASGVLRKGDILLEVAGHTVANNGTVRYQDRLRTGLGVLLGDFQVGDKLPVKIWRDGRAQEVALTLAPESSLVPQWRYDRTPSYLVHGGLVFQQLTLDFISTWRDWWDNAPAELLNLLYAGERTAERQQVVVLSSVLADEINVGFESMTNQTVREVNGQVPRDLKHFSELLREEGKGTELLMSRGGLIALEADSTREANPRILERYRVHPACSEDLQ